MDLQHTKGVPAHQGPAIALSISHRVWVLTPMAALPSHWDSPVALRFSLPITPSISTHGPGPHRGDGAPSSSSPSALQSRASTAAAPAPQAGGGNGKQIAEVGNILSTLACQDTRLLMKTQLCRHHLNDRPNFKASQTICFAAPPPQ